MSYPQLFSIGTLGGARELATARRFAALACRGERGAEAVDEFVRLCIATNYAPHALSLFKNMVEREQDDFDDLHDVLARLGRAERERFYYHIGVAAGLHAGSEADVKLICDIDNTVVESRVPRAARAAPVGALVPHVADVINLVTDYTRESTPAFVSLRPRCMERASIRRLKRLLREARVCNFSFYGGRLATPCMQLARSRAAVLAAARAKLAIYTRLRALYPTSTFVFLGDNTQGDYIFAALITRVDARNYAFIRRVALPGREVEPGSAMWPPTIACDSPNIFPHNDYLYVKHKLVELRLHP